MRTHVLTAVMLAAAVGAGGCATAGPGTASCLPLPPEAPPGEAAVKALGSVLDEPCTDTIVKSASCASYLIPFTLLSPPR